MEALKKMMMALTAMAALTFGVSFMTGCDDGGGAEEVGERMDDAADDVADGVEDMADDVEDGVEDMAE